MVPHLHIFIYSNGESNPWLQGDLRGNALPGNYVVDDQTFKEQLSGAVAVIQVRALASG